MPKKKPEECPSIPGWLVSFGDLMSLLLTFFILLYAMSTVDVTKALKFLSYFQGEPNYKPIRISVVPPIVPFSTNVVKKVKKRIKRILPPHAYQLSITTKYVMIRLFNDIVFKDTSYQLTEKAKQTLKEIAQVLKKLPKNQKFYIKVHGYATIKDTSQLPPDIVDAWDLSIKRAEAVAFYLMKQGIDPSRFFIAGYGDTRPIYTWNNPLLNRRNDRVEIFIEVDQKKGTQ
ncbi:MULTISPECIES: flagellar motor protein MotB [unclassified Nitratiruptor]|uniref:OmpA/MotB family protein n=1 Tax=unclassified Nitratiruptor TaxID=2624044 RepID=UPI001914E79E|nr:MULTISPECIES: flagellar motor protein MotB [unclassified Nitratiruptor]BCD60302.1 chemotaxis protein MotB [Nitratiruptor sp. YY08-10]BCD64208.1 chemotaxis protein MotB [Nitratiruptor sp. YY08-14]